MKQTSLSSGLAILLAVMAAPALGGCAASVSDPAEDPVLTTDGAEAVADDQEAVIGNGCSVGGYAGNSGGYGYGHGPGSYGFGNSPGGYGFGHGPGSYGFGNSAGGYGYGNHGGYGYGSSLGGNWYGNNAGGYGRSFGNSNAFGGFGGCRR